MSLSVHVIWCRKTQQGSRVGTTYYARARCHRDSVKIGLYFTLYALLLPSKYKEERERKEEV